MTLQKTFRKQGESAIASYSFSELVSGLGFIKFYLAATEGDSGASYILTEQQIYSFWGDTRYVETALTTNSTSTNTFLSSVFNLPRVVNGVAILTIGFDYDTSSPGSAGSITATLSKFDGTTTTPLATAVSQTISMAARNGTWTFRLPLTQTIIKKGEQLKLVIFVDHNGGTDRFTAYGHDPQNRDGAKITPSTNANSITSSNLLIPFKINL